MHNFIIKTYKKLPKAIREILGNLFGRPITPIILAGLTLYMILSVFGDDTFNGDIRYWDTSNVTTMTSMFHGAAAFNQDIGAWDTSSVTNMSAMFYQAASFNQDLSGWCASLISSKPNAFDYISNAEWIDNAALLQLLWDLTCTP